MPWEVFTRSLEIAQENNIPAINFFGGEPLLNPKILPMLKETLERGFSVILATNCRLLSDNRLFTKFINITKKYQERIVVFTGRDRFHLVFFDPAEVISRLKGEGYQVNVADYSDQTIAISDFNQGKVDLQGLDTRFSCCAGVWTDYLGVLPDGGWTICPPSLLAFGSVFTHSLPEITDFKRSLPLRCNLGCTDCLKDFNEFRKRFGGTGISGITRATEG